MSLAADFPRDFLDGRLVCQPFDDDEGRWVHVHSEGTYRKLGVKALESVNVGGGPNGMRPALTAFKVEGVARIAA